MFDWDEEKNRLNIQKHGIGFAMAARIFEGPVLTSQDDRMDYGEIREISIGLIDGIAAVLQQVALIRIHATCCSLLFAHVFFAKPLHTFARHALVVHTPRDGRSRIISARKANRSERKRYEEAIYS
jgi:uncharacterized DUF497 family protein